ncbi:uncharacterized protein LOC129753145 [Uranotaenia lowii]|uniref:uncharacterized protein LOC129753145 n=1 Tax=Uranotaenia lowii TaxID=190385 RepID=UPI00247AED81|nr:uncharacterized protein LOC129753145 [Uranotaenia lowii]
MRCDVFNEEDGDCSGTKAEQSEVDKSSVSFLIDTGADISVIPPTPRELMNPKKTDQLFAANGSAINTYGTKRLNINIGLRRPFVWVFTIADVKSPIIGADFLKHHDLLVDLHRSKLIENQINLEINNMNVVSEPLITTYDVNSPFADILRKFQDITMLSINRRPTKAQTVHQIFTNGQSVFCRFRCLPVDKLKEAKAELRFLMEQGIFQPSKMIRFYSVEGWIQIDFLLFDKFLTRFLLETPEAPFYVKAMYTITNP